MGTEQREEEESKQTATQAFPVDLQGRKRAVSIQTKLIGPSE